MTGLLRKIKNKFNNKVKRLCVIKIWFVEAKTVDEAIAIAEEKEYNVLEVRPDKNGPWR